MLWPGSTCRIVSTALSGSGRLFVDFRPLPKQVTRLTQVISADHFPADTHYRCCVFYLGLGAGRRPYASGGADKTRSRVHLHRLRRRLSGASIDGAEGRIHVYVLSISDAGRYVIGGRVMVC